MVALRLSIIEVVAAMLQTFLNQLRTMGGLEVCPKSVRCLGMSPQRTGGAGTTEGGAELVGAEAKVGEDSYASVTDEMDELLLQASQIW